MASRTDSLDVLVLGAGPGRVVAVGWVADTDGLRFDNAGVQIDQRK